MNSIKLSYCLLQTVFAIKNIHIGKVLTNIPATSPAGYTQPIETDLSLDQFLKHWVWGKQVAWNVWEGGKVKSG